MRMTNYEMCRSYGSRDWIYPYFPGLKPRAIRWVRASGSRWFVVRNNVELRIINEMKDLQAYELNLHAIANSRTDCKA